MSNSLDAPFADRAKRLAEAFPAGQRFSLQEAAIRARILQKGIQRSPMPAEPEPVPNEISFAQRASLRQRLAQLMAPGRRFSLAQTARHLQIARAMLAASATRARLAVENTVSVGPEPAMAFSRPPPRHAPTFVPVPETRDR